MAYINRKKNKNEKFSLSPIFLYQALSSCRFSLQPSNILCYTAISLFVFAFLLFYYLAKLLLLSLLLLFVFFSCLAPTITTFLTLSPLFFYLTNNILKNKKKLVLVNAGSIPGYNSGFFHLYFRPKYTKV